MNRLVLLSLGNASLMLAMTVAALVKHNLPAFLASVAVFYLSMFNATFMWGKKDSATRS